MGISPTRAEARLTKTIEAHQDITRLEKKIKSLLKEQDQRQTQVTQLKDQIDGLKSRMSPDVEHAGIPDDIAKAEKMLALVVQEHGEANALWNRLADDLNTLRAASPNIEVQVERQRSALARKQAVYPQRLLRHLSKCKAHGWADARMAKLTEHKTNFRAAHKASESTEPTPTEQLAESLRG